MKDFEFDYEGKEEADMAIIEWRELTRKEGDSYKIVNGIFSISQAGEHIMLDVGNTRAIFAIIDKENTQRIPEGMRILRAGCRKFDISGKNISATNVLDKLNEYNCILTITHLKKGRIFALSTHGPFQPKSEEE